MCNRCGFCGAELHTLLDNRNEGRQNDEVERPVGTPSIGYCRLLKIQHLFGEGGKGNDSCVAWPSFGTPNSGNRTCSQHFDWLLGHYFSYWAELPSLNTKEGA